MNSVERTVASFSVQQGRYFLRRDCICKSVTFSNFIGPKSQKKKTLIGYLVSEFM